MPSPSTPKPRSMKAGARNVLRSNDSASLWNCTLSPGWTENESEVLRKALMKFGIGNWAKIIDSGYLPGKTNAQMNLQLQRLLGQQSTAEFAGLHIDPKVIGARNSKIQGPDIKRKNNTIVNTGGKLSREELKQRVIKNREMYELPKEVWENIQIFSAAETAKMIKEKNKDIKKLKRQLKMVRNQIKDMALLLPADRVSKLKAEVRRSSTIKSKSSSPVPTSPAKVASSSSSPSTGETPAKKMRLV
ncbi:uncharacterized protein BX664DRAFT_340834 [Halteromyces radiatus]|uniref:uncharacterized protein n=1 Tax=Halteromyces radiatus TaxID=101107 RepID=UPI00221EC1EF|nr:uncharacterized protein BX664DRAFT_340834 [Halteromyces radiatus]KAI8081620.1 hypothetical protein BX664DRAFT_340834 [Halteromyces radiatus]